MEFINLIPNVVVALVAIMLIRMSVFILDVPIINNWLGLERYRRKIAEEMKLFLDKNEDRKKVNKKIVLLNFLAAIYFVFAGVVLYFIIMKVTK